MGAGPRIMAVAMSAVEGAIRALSMVIAGLSAFMAAYIHAPVHNHTADKTTAFGPSISNTRRHTHTHTRTQMRPIEWDTAAVK